VSNKKGRLKLEIQVSDDLFLLLHNNRQAKFSTNVYGMKQQIMNKTQAEANATLYAREIETLAGRLNMGIRDFDAAYGGLNVVGESLIDDGVLN